MLVILFVVVVLDNLVSFEGHVICIQLLVFNGNATVDLRFIIFLIGC